jgi:serine/threonine-protein kinase HipA
MSAVAEVLLWGTRIGAVASGDDGIGAFEYEPGFLASRIEIAPLTMPLGPGVFRFAALLRETFHGLPGVLADSLPDRFGNALIDSWLARQGRTRVTFGAVERLCYVGARGMGALTFRPAIGPQLGESEALDLAALVDLAGQLQRDREAVQIHAPDGLQSDTLRQILQVGTSAGGARAKAVIAYNPETGEVRSGQSGVGRGFEHWLLKFDGVSNNRDRELADSLGYGAVEYAYSRMARAAGIEMADCRILSEGGRRHFMTRRFDRTDTGDRVHMATLGGLAHLDFNAAGAHSYEEALQVIARLELDAPAREQLVLRMIFNVVARNQDDHVKNIAFLMNRRGQWTLAPAYDVTWSYNPLGDWTSRHQMSINGLRDGFELNDLISCARAGGVRPQTTRRLFARVREAVAHWSEFADIAEVDPSWRKQIAGSFRTAIS